MGDGASDGELEMERRVAVSDESERERRAISSEWSGVLRADEECR